MKKILSILLTVTMVLSLVASFRAPTASAYPGTTVFLTTTNATTSLYRNSQLSVCSQPPSNSNPYWILDKFSVFSVNPFVGSPGAITQLNDCSLGTAGMKYEVYHMGDYIYGYVTGHTFTGSFWTIALVKLDSTCASGYRVIDAQHQAVGTNRFSMATANAEYDGEYFLVFADGVDYFPGDCIDPLAGSGVFAKEAIWITYNLTLAPVTINTCAYSATVTGWLTRAPGSPITQRVQIAITYPDLSLAGNYDIAVNSSGYFAITFPINHSDPNYPTKYIGKYYIFVRYEDPVNYIGWPNSLGLGEPNNYGEIIYSYIDNTPSITMTLSTYISPIRIYKSQSGQPLLLRLVDQNGNPVTGLVAADFAVTGATAFTVAEISAGFYRFVLDVATSVDVRIKATKTFYGTSVSSNQVIINTIDKTVFNPYVDVTAPDAIAPYGQGPWNLDSVQSVYDKLPCTIGNSLEIMVDSWDMPASMVPDWYVYDASWSINGPVEDLTGQCYYSLGDYMDILITQKGSISVSVNMTAWSRVNKDCPAWGGVGELALDTTSMSQNACCYTYDKTFNICDVNSCTYGGVTLTGANITNSQTVEVGKKIDKLTVSVDNTAAPTSLACSCPYDAVLIYMVDSNGNLLKNAITVDTWGGYTVSGSMIWYNPQYYVNPVDPLDLLGLNMFDGPHIADQPIQKYLATGIYSTTGALLDNGLKFEGGCPVTLDGITFNYPTGTSCGYSLVVKVFGWNRTYDACGNPTYTFPMIAEDLYPITVTPSVTTLSATPTITEGTVDPTQILAGVPAIVDITNPGFSVDKGDTNWNAVSWKYYLNGTLLDSYSWCNTYIEYGMTVTSSKTDTGYRFVFSRPFTTAGTFKIVGTSYYYNCTKKEVVSIEITVVKPTFTVKIGLKDCDKTIIANDGHLTEGFDELVYVTALDPRTDIQHDFSTDPNWSLSVSAIKNACGLPLSKVCGVVEGPGCSYGLPIRIVGYVNPNIAVDPGTNQISLYFNSLGAKIKVTSFSLASPSITVDPKTVDFTIPATATHLTFTVRDSHIDATTLKGHPVTNVNVTIGNTGAFGVGASGYSWTASAGTTGCKGEVDWAFVPPYSGKYKITANPVLALTCALPCGWPGINTTATIEAIYKAPVVDTTAPVVTATATATVTKPSVSVSGTVTDNVAVTQLWIGAMKVDFAPDGTFAATVSLNPGANTIKVVAYDAAGNKGEKDLTVTYTAPVVTTITVQIGSDIMTINGKVVQLDAAPEIVNGSTFLPLRAIGEALGATVTWIPETQGITVTLGSNTIGLQIGNGSAVVNGNVVTVVPPYIKNGRTMVPIRIISEGLGATVTWDGVNKIVTITVSQ